MLWLAGWWVQSVQEWGNLDFYRIDKYLTLVRLMLYESFCVLKVFVVCVSGQEC